MVYPLHTEVMATPLPSFDVQVPPGTDAKVPVRGVLQVVWRRKMLVLLTMAVIVAGAVAVIAQLTPYYVSTATLLIDPQQTQPLPQLPSPDGPQIDMVAVKTQVAIIQSVDLAKRVVETLHLVDRPEAAAWLGSPLGTVGKWVTFFRTLVGEQSEPAAEPTRADRVQALAAVLLNHVTASNDGKSYLVQISAQTKDAHLSATLANTLAQAYLDFNRKLKIHAIEDANSRFFDQLPPLAQKVREADRLVQKFRSDNGLTPVATPGQSEGGTLAEYQLAQVNSQLIQAFADRVQLEGRMRQVDEALHGRGQLNAIPEIVGSTLIQELRREQAKITTEQAGLGSSAMGGNPTMMALRAQKGNLAATIDAEIVKIALSVESSVQAAKAREDTLRQRLDQLKTLVAAQSEAGIKLRDLQNQADASRDVYLSYLHRFQQTASLGLMQQPDAELIAPADVSMAPAGPKRVQLVMLAVAVAMILAVLCALVRDRFGAATGFVSASVLETATGLAVIGSLPKLRRGTEQSSSSEIRFFHRETINHVRATLQFGGSQYRARVVLVTSSVPREGKSHVAEALAESISARGGRALLIRCDQPHEAADAHPAGTATAAQPRLPARQLTITQTSSGPHIGKLTPLEAGARALPSLRLARDELSELRDQYDMIVLDGPSVIACANAELLCNAVDGVLLVVRSAETTRGVILAARRILDVYGVRTIGAVLNNVDMKQLARSGGDLAEFYNSYVRDVA